MTFDPQTVLNDPKFKPARDVQNALEIIDQASNVRRYSRDFMIKPEDLLQHIGFCVSFIYMTAKRIDPEGFSINLGDALKRATVHDFEETITGDVARPTKYCSPEVTKGLKAYERKAMKRVEATLGIEIYHDWANAKDEYLEGQLVAVADYAAVVYKVMTEVGMFGNKSFMRVLLEIEPALEELKNNINAMFVPTVVELQDIVTRTKHGDVRFGEYFKGV